MSGKDDYIFKKQNLLTTHSGRKIFKSGLIRDNKYTSFKFYINKSKKEYDGFVQRYKEGIYGLIKADSSPIQTHRDFIKEIGGTHELELPQNEIEALRLKLKDPADLFDRINRILNSNFIKMTFPVFYALFDGYAVSISLNDYKMRNNVIDGHLIAIDLSEPMDRIVDRDEDNDYLDDYKLMNPYILEIARQKISQGGDSVLKAFEEGFKDARIGQFIDTKLKTRPESISDENMIGCYKKYRAIMGTAGRNMALNRKPLADIFHLGMAKAGESVGCGNEIQDAIRNGRIKIPSWPLFFSILSGDVKRGFELTIKKGKAYLEEAKLAIDVLPEDFEHKQFLEFLLLTVSHYNQYWFNELNRRDLFALLQKNLNGTVKV